MLKKAKDGGFLPGWSVNGRCGDGVVIFHLLFVDDTIKREREENLDSHSYGVYIQLRKYIYTRLGVLTTIHVTYIKKKKRLYTINSLYSIDTLVLSKPNQDQLTYLGYLCGLRSSRGLALTWKKAS